MNPILTHYCYIFFLISISEPELSTDRSCFCYMGHQKSEILECQISKGSCFSKALITNVCFICHFGNFLLYFPIGKTILVLFILLKNESTCGRVK